MRDSPKLTRFSKSTGISPVRSLFDKSRIPVKEKKIVFVRTLAAIIYNKLHFIVS